MRIESELFAQNFEAANAANSEMDAKWTEIEN